ncbi:MAG TPA: SDR family oxidoreductase [Pilimelia sp.]|nr:SDR family oxidoreductase [Pilimelia sp.]
MPVTTPHDAITVITGGAHGIGRALAERFAAEGARLVVVADLDEASAQAVAASLTGTGTGTAALGVRLDVSDEAAVRDLVDRITREYGPIDIWCSNAGLVAGLGLGDDADWERSWQVHVLAHLYAARALLPGMTARGRGHLLATASAAGLITEVNTAPYTVTKHGAVALAEWLAIRYGNTGVTFSCLCPMGVRTRILDHVDPESLTVADGVLEPSQVADAVIEALAEGRFLILPHPQVATFEQRRAGDRDRWLAGMRRTPEVQRVSGVAQ